MKGLLCVVVLAINSCFSDDAFIKECMEENDLGEEFMERMKEDRALIDESKCFALCLMEKLDVLDDTGHVKLDRFEDQLVKNAERALDFETVKKECEQLREAIDCENARTLHKCALAQ